ncbi:MAG: type II secretion system protein [Methylococcales bacterium]|nr:MAG: type II secretion system protein [Methylococcales bacterium]
MCMKRALVVVKHQTGLSLIELIIFIVIVSLAMAGVFAAINFNAQHSVDPVVKKQALAIAEAMLEEIELMPFTYCDPNDTQATTASSTAACTTGYIEVMGPDTISGATETRYSATTPFDNVNDYNGFSMAAGAILDITGANLDLSGYAMSVTVVNNALNGVGVTNVSTTPSLSLLITVTVTGPNNTTVSLQGFRSQYAPNSIS